MCREDTSLCLFMAKEGSSYSASSLSEGNYQFVVRKPIVSRKETTHLL